MPEGSEFVAQVYAAINARDRAAIRALTGPDIVFATTVEAYRGPEALLEWMDEGDDAFDDFSVELLEVEELGENVLASMRQRGRGKASGAEVDDHITHVWTLRNWRPTRLESRSRRRDSVNDARAHQSQGPAHSHHVHPCCRGDGKQTGVRQPRPSSRGCRRPA